MKNGSRKRLWTSRFSQGLCIYCGLNKYLPHKKGCDTCLKKKSIITRRFVKLNPEKQKQYRLSIRNIVLVKYGGECKCCGENNLVFLTIDHINQDGAKERKELYGSNTGASHRWFLKLKREKLREDLRVLCYNCNNASFHLGCCPHEQSKKVNT